MEIESFILRRIGGILREWKTKSSSRSSKDATFLQNLYRLKISETIADGM
ncbi:hypothetical protein [Hydrogenimonas cancrithermarum]|nr:hypothetical protein [Hydrogenimonas cancrithermarum]